MEIQYTLAEIKNIAQQLWQLYANKKVWAFHGQLGAGKTTLIHALCDVLKITDAVGSPTFAIINEYKSEVAGKVFHTDWYRLKDEEEAITAGVEDCIYSGNLCFVEWPDKVPSLMPDDALHIFIETIDEKTRRLHTQE